MNLSFKNRIAIYYMLATATVIAVVFFIIYLVVQTVVFSQLDADLSYEAHKHTEEVKFLGDSIVFVNKKEWEEREHREVQVNPVFIQIVDVRGKVMDKSPNLKDGYLEYKEGEESYVHFDTKLIEKAIRQIQIPIGEGQDLKGFIITAMSQEGAVFVLESLRRTLLLLLPIVLVGLFFITRFLAGKSIIPIKTITETTDSISRNNLNERVDLPQNKDELHALTNSINQLLERIQKAIEREKQFTADASHQLRTPLAVLRGTLEVLNRKPRSTEEYQAKIGFSINEIDRITEIVNQLLVLARFDTSKMKISSQEVDLQIAVNDALSRYRQLIEQKRIQIQTDVKGQAIISSDPYYVDLILDNIISNAVKYSPSLGQINIAISSEGNRTKISVQDQGIGIQNKDLDSIFEPFYRSNELAHKEIRGNGLGLSIAQKACEITGASINVVSEINQGSCFTVEFS